MNWPKGNRSHSSLASGRRRPGMAIVFSTVLLASLAGTGCETVQPPGGAERPLPGEAGPAGLSCWDLNGNRLADADEDVNNDGVVDVFDCRGPAGQPGQPGQPGPEGDDGDDGDDGSDGVMGLACWDLNTNGIADPEEDIDGDGVVDVDDCQGDRGSSGRPGSSGPAGPGGPTGPAGLSCWDLNENGVQDPDEDVNSDGVFDVEDCRPGPPGPQGQQGPAGLACWHLNTNGEADPEEDVNTDGIVDLADCRTGVAGPQGPVGPQGESGPPGTSCWDTNGNGTADAAEDVNSDGFFDAADCVGPEGPQGPQGDQGPPGESGGLSTAEADGRYWMLGGNDSIDPGTQFVGTTDNTELRLGVNGSTALRMTPNTTSPNLIGGHPDNSAGDVAGAVVSGGGTASDGGALGPNQVHADYATVAGGVNNVAEGTAATVVGGQGNTASGENSLAAGSLAHAAHAGSFVWSDTDNTVYSSQRPDQFAVRASGGVRMDVNIGQFVEVRVSGNRLIDTSNGAYLSSGGIWTNASDRAAKTNLVPVDRQAILQAVAEMPIYTWNHLQEDANITHIGPMAQDFWAAFQLGADDEHIGTIDADGVALTAIQGLYEIIEQQQQTIQEQRQQIEQLRMSIAPLKLQMNMIQAQLEQAGE